MSEYADTQKHVCEQCCSLRVLFSILAHLAYFAQSCTLKTNWWSNRNWWQMSGGKLPMLTTFFHTAMAAITDDKSSKNYVCNRISISLPHKRT